MTKPFELDELLARIEAVSRRPKEIKNHQIIIDKNIILDAGARKIIKNRKEVELTPKEFEILEYLASNP